MQFLQVVIYSLRDVKPDWIYIYVGGIEITPDLFERFEENISSIKHSAGAYSDFKINDVLYIKAAAAWKSSTYKTFWPYTNSIESSYFEAKVIKSKDSGISLKFVAFELGRTIYYNTSWLSLYATRVLPQSYTLISREDYELYEAHGDLDRDDQEKDDYGNG